MSGLGKRFIEAVERSEWLNQPRYRFEKRLALVYNLLGKAGTPTRNVLHGTWLGHPLHPLLVSLPTGAWACALLLDGVDVVAPGQDGVAQAAQLTVAIGIVGALGAVATGLTDWQYTHDDARRTGIVHGALNTAALALYAGSLLARRSGKKKRARAAGALGFALVACANYLGAHLVYGQRIGVDHGDDPTEPRQFIPVIAFAALEENEPRHVAADGVAAVLVRAKGAVHAFTERCPHLGAPMCDGFVHRGTLVCPWHGSRFDLATGDATQGPATAPLTRFETRVRNDVVELRAVPRERTSLPQMPVGKRARNES